MESAKYYIDTVIEQEKIRHIELRKIYEQKLLKYPKGFLGERNTKGRKYCYFRYREGKKVITKYTSTMDKYDALIAQVDERNKIAEYIKAIDAEIERMDKMSAVK